MAQYTSVYSDFLERTREISVLRSEASRLERSATSTTHGERINAYCRGAVVLLSSHIEAYIKELGECALDRIYEREVCRSKLPEEIFYYSSQDSVGQISASSDPRRIARRVFTFIDYDGQNWRRSGALDRVISATTFNSGFSNPKFKKVKGYFGRFGYREFERDLKAKLCASSNTVINAVDHIIDTRNLIAHGDASANKTPSEVNSMLSHAKVFCRTTDQVFADWCKLRLCSIR